MANCPRDPCRVLPGSFLALLLAVSPGAAPAQTDVNTQRIVATDYGCEFQVPGSMQRMPPSRHRPISYQGALGGEPARLHLNAAGDRFTTVSRLLFDMTEDSKLVQVVARRISGEPAAQVERRLQEPERMILELVICPQRRGVSLEIQLPPHPAAQAIAEADRIFASFGLITRSGYTLASTGRDQVRQRELELGFVDRARERVRLEQSEHYRLYTTAPTGKDLLDLLEKKLLPMLGDLTGTLPPTFDEEGKLPIFLHNTWQDYVRSARQMGIPQASIDAMQGYAWDRYYSTSYSDARSAVHIHEGTHQFMTAVLGLDGGGAWLQEGLARWVECMHLHRAPDRDARNILRSQPERFPALRQMCAASSFLHDTTAGNQPSECYDIAASLVKYLAQEHHNEFRGLLLEVGVLPAGQMLLLDDALGRSIRRNLAQVETAWRQWLLAD
jgi:hypothetical protein